eukprot:scaffold237886_cov33-Tisochrysis_lutea.AAC.1
MAAVGEPTVEHPPVAQPEVRLELPEPADPLLDQLATSHKEYVRLYRAGRVAQRENALGELERLGAVQRAPINDKEGRPIFVFFPSRLAGGEEKGLTLEKVMSHALLLMHDTVVVQDKPYTVIWVTNNLEPDRLGYFWFRSTYKMVPRAYHKNMRSLCIVHPSISTRLMLLMLSYLLKTSFWEKLVYADRVEFLDEVMDYTALELPSDLLMYDRFLDKEMETQAAELQATAGGPWGSAASSSPFGGSFGAGLTGTPLGSTHESRFEEWKREQQLQPNASSNNDPKMPKYNRDFNRDDEEVESEDEEEDEDEPRIVDVPSSTEATVPAAPR